MYILISIIICLLSFLKVLYSKNPKIESIFLYICLVSFFNLLIYTQYDNALAVHIIFGVICCSMMYVNIKNYFYNRIFYREIRSVTIPINMSYLILLGLQEIYRIKLIYENSYSLI